MNARYVVTNRLGLTVAGQRLRQGEEVSLSNGEAAPLLAAGAIDRSAAASSSPSRTRRRKAAGSAERVRLDD